MYMYVLSSQPDGDGPIACTQIQTTYKQQADAIRITPAPRHTHIHTQYLTVLQHARGEFVKMQRGRSGRGGGKYKVLGPRVLTSQPGISLILIGNHPPTTRSTSVPQPSNAKKVGLSLYEVRSTEDGGRRRTRQSPPSYDRMWLGSAEICAYA